MNRTRLLWTAWALVPVGLLAFHYGPGQRASQAERAAELVARADAARDGAEALQSSAHALHVAAVEARARAAASAGDAALHRAALEAVAAEEAAYAASGAAWSGVAGTLEEAQALLAEAGSPRERDVRIAKAEALVRSGEVAAGANELEDMLGELTAERRAAHRAPGAGAGDAALEHRVREELATAYYHGARLQRLAGAPEDEWRDAARHAREQFRYLAEEARARGEAGGRVLDLERNVELVLDLEQSAGDQVALKVKPRDCPSGQCKGLGTRKGKGRKPSDGTPSPGAGMQGEIGDGW
jgi:hypothetical protein